MDSKPISNELQDMVMQQAREVAKPMAKGGSLKKLKPINQVMKDSALGHTFDCIRADEGLDPSDLSSLDLSSESKSDPLDSFQFW